MSSWTGKRSRGMTLAEVLLASALAALLLAAAAVGISSLSKSVRANDSAIKARQSATRTLEYVLGKVRRAREVHLLPEPPSGGGYTTLRTLDDAIWDGTDWSLTGRKYTYFTFSGGKLYAGPDDDLKNASPLLSNVQAVQFRGTLAGTPAQYRDIAMEITFISPDPTGGQQSTPYTIAGNATVRSLE